MASAWESHLALPSFSVIDPKSKNTCVTTIFDTDDWPDIPDEGADPPNADRSNVLFVGEFKV